MEVGLDIVKDKLMEDNVFSPGGLASIARFTGIDFSAPIIEDLERKVALRRGQGKNLTNVQLATA